MSRALRLLCGSLLAAGLSPFAAHGAECVTLSPENYAEYAPGSLIPRVFFGDYVLRNDRIVVAVADPTLISGRSASRWSIANVAGCVIGLQRRGESNDTFRAYYPAPLRFKPDAPGLQSDFPDEARTWLLPGREPTSGKRVVLRLPAYELAGGRSLDDLAKLPAERRGAPKPRVEVSYTLEDDWPCVLVEVAYVNPTDRPVPLNLDTCLRVDGAEGGCDFDGRLFWARDKWSRQAYGVLAEGHALKPGKDGAHGFRLAHVTPDGREPVLPPQGTYRVARRLFPGSSLQEVKAAAAAALGLAAPVPEPAPAESNETARVSADITDADGAPIPCKLQFRGRDGTPDPFFGPETGADRVRNLCYASDGRVRENLPPGRYDVIVTCGPEYDAEFLQANLIAKQETRLQARLNRRVTTTGYISADLHNHSAVSGPNEIFYVYPYAKDPVVDGDSLASPLGRVLNLLCEQIEFAPATEHNFIYSYAPLLKALGAEGRMATCPGIGLTAGRRHTVNHQNVFPAVFSPGRQDGGARQRPEHIGQLAWLKQWDNAADMLIQIVQPHDSPIAPARNVVLDVRELESIVQGSPIPGRSRCILDWIDKLNEGYRLPAVVGSGALDNFHGSGNVRTYVQSPTDDPRAIDPLDVVRAVRAGRAIMTTGPFMEVEVQREGSSLPALPGDDLASPDGRIGVRVRVQSSNWARVDRIQVLVNGRRSPDLDFQRSARAGMFADGVMQFDRLIPVQLTNDAHVIVVASGRGPNLRRCTGPSDAEVTHVAVANPIWVDFGADGYAPHSPLDDKVESTLSFVKPVLEKRNAEPGRVRLTLRNTGSNAAVDSVSLEVVPPDAARIVGPIEQSYFVPPGGEATVEWDLALSDSCLNRAFPVLSTYNNVSTFGVRVARSGKAPGRKPAAHAMEVDHAMATLPPLASPDEVAAALTGVTPYVLRTEGNPLAELRFAVSGSNLAVHAAVRDAKPRRGAVPWEGACVQVFGAMPGRSTTDTGVPGRYHPVAEVDLLPQIGTNPVTAFSASQTKPGLAAAPEVQLISAPTPGGYALSALIPLARLGIDADGAAKRFLLECRVSAGEEGNYRRASLFRSSAPLTDSSGFGRMRLE